ncbi:ACR066Cp [Eremothecium gossypii ATCC 10895]|uniref:ACR066Cp n=1 Tax=Eremothecium gossypii (strain ATCC 10895 / CBS 109.51 / FGSC 9923 / NRRL Y-1056) TaxID=284811 RepID=Q75C51_EREGS|nr:ACR066Cp [Eremothecium gossypii ATCC 10895]AAS51292.1 ACR066Cp [Eremothecium gossypii ATCC 10895]AEY95584.1 FACR066Cp [Eremothecium gossypii FDAG1]
MSVSPLVLFDFSTDNPNTLPREYDLAVARICVLGHGGSGKSSLVLRWLHGLESGLELGSLAEDIYHKRVNYEALHLSRSQNEYRDLCANPRRLSRDARRAPHNVNPLDAPLVVRHHELDVQLLDAAGMDPSDYSEIRRLQVEQADGFVLCCDYTNEESLGTLQLLHRYVVSLRGDDVPIVISCCKCDLEDDRTVFLSDVQQLAREFELPPDSVLETSALENVGVDELFFLLLQRIDYYKEAMRAERRRQAGCDDFDCAPRPDPERRSLASPPPPSTRHSPDSTLLRSAASSDMACPSARVFSAPTSTTPSISRLASPPIKRRRPTIRRMRSQETSSCIIV